jgi:hypothetical protein
MVKVDGIEVSEWTLDGENVVFDAAPGGEITVSYSHIGTQPEIDAVVAFYPDVFDPAFYAERVMYWTQVQAAIAPFLPAE